MNAHASHQRPRLASILLLTGILLLVHFMYIPGAFGSDGEDYLEPSNPPGNDISPSISGSDSDYRWGGSNPDVYAWVLLDDRYLQSGETLHLSNLVSSSDTNDFHFTFGTNPQWASYEGMHHVSDCGSDDYSPAATIQADGEMTYHARYIKGLGSDDCANVAMHFNWEKSRCSTAKWNEIPRYRGTGGPGSGHGDTFVWGAGTYAQAIDHFKFDVYDNDGVGINDDC